MFYIKSVKLLELFILKLIIKQLPFLRNNLNFIFKSGNTLNLHVNKQTLKTFNVKALIITINSVFSISISLSPTLEHARLEGGCR